MAASVLPVSSSASRMAADLAVHHPRRRDHVGARARLRDGDRRVPLERRVVVDLAGVGEQTAVTVVGVLVEAVVGHQDERVAHLVAQVAQRDLHHAVGGVGARAAGVLGGRARRRGSPRGRRGRRAPAPPCGGSPGCAARRPASTRSAPARRALPSRRAARPGRRPRAGPRPPAAAARACGGAGACVASGTSRRPGYRASPLWRRYAATVAVSDAETERRVATRPSMVCCSASASTRRPRSLGGGRGDGPDRHDQREGVGARVDLRAEVVDRRRRRERHRVEPSLDARARPASGSGVAGTVRYTGSTSTS